MPSFIVHSRTTRDWSGLAFRSDGPLLVATGEGNDVPNLIVQAFNPARDVFYLAPEDLSPEELVEETSIHFPRSFVEQANARPVASMLSASVLIQLVEGTTPAISPLAALKRILESTGTVNSAILQADNGGLLFVRRAGDAFTAHASPHSLLDFMKIEPEMREKHLPDFAAEELILSGSDLDHFTPPDDDPITIARRISVEDFSGLIDFSEEAAKIVELNPHLYALAIGAASVYAEIIRGAIVAV